MLLVAAALAGVLVFQATRSHVEQRSTFTYGSGTFECSKPIAGTWTKNPNPNDLEFADWFVPVRLSDLQKFCRTTSSIEYHAVVDVLARPDVAAVIGRYPTEVASVRALAAKYITDPALLHRILPEYRNVKIYCVIVVQSPEGNRFFLELVDGAHLEQADPSAERDPRTDAYVEVPAEKFLASLHQADPSDISEFWMSLH
jgi:hypothetical protein